MELKGVTKSVYETQPAGHKTHEMLRKFTAR